jgi:hypothetical protein
MHILARLTQSSAASALKTGIRYRSVRAIPRHYCRLTTATNVLCMPSQKACLISPQPTVRPPQFRPNWQAAYHSVPGRAREVRSKHSPATPSEGRITQETRAEVLNMKHVPGQR